MTQTTRMRRLRYNPLLRDMVREHALSIDDLVLPLFIKAGTNIHDPISSMPGHYQFSIDKLDAEIDEIVKLGIKAVILFGIPESKDAEGSSSWQDDGIVQQAIKTIKAKTSDLLVIADVCFCEYTDHAHCGVMLDNDVDNDLTLDNLAKQSVSLAKAGADIIAPSGMLDGMVGAIRNALDTANYYRIPILSYAVKYASSFYGAFREAAESELQFGDRRTHQMDSANGDRALREAALDIEEGADMLMVKPAMNYLDVIYRVKQAFPSVPMCAYQVSGEFAMIKAAAQNGWIDEAGAMMESLMSIKRAGADFIITYFAKEVAKQL